VSHPPQTYLPIDHPRILLFRGNTYLIDKFFNRSIVKIDKWEGSNWESPEQAKLLKYSYNDKNLDNFSEWLEELEKSERFISVTNGFIKIQKALKDEDDTKKRRQLVEEADQLIKDY
jgi:hypothetical protein